MKRFLMLFFIPVLILFYNCDGILPVQVLGISDIVIDNTELSRSGHHNTQIPLPGFGNSCYNVDVGLIVEVKIFIEHDGAIIGDPIALNF